MATRVSAIGAHLSSSADGAGRAHHTNCLVIGGTGVSGGRIVRLLLDRGHTVTILHTGKHKPPPALYGWYYDGSVRIILANPFDERSMRAALTDQRWGTVFSMYGKLSMIAELFGSLSGQEGPRCSQFISVGGAPIYDLYGAAPDREGLGLSIGGQLVSPINEDSATIGTTTGDLSGRYNGHDPKLGKMVEAEQAVFKFHPTATHFRFPVMYGPLQLMPMEWMVVRRCLDKRRHIIVPNAGLQMQARAYSGNAAKMIMLGFEQREKSAGEIFNVSDQHSLTVRQWIMAIADGLGHTFEFVSMPGDLAVPAIPMVSTQLDDGGNSISLSCIKAAVTLGYTDHTPQVEALKQTAKWLAANPPDPALTARILGDPFDYETEDKLIAAWKRGDIKACRSMTWPVKPTFPYFYYGRERDQVKQHAGTYDPARPMTRK